MIFKKSALIKFRIGNIQMLYTINYGGVGFVFHRYLFNLFSFRCSLSPFLLLHAACHDYLLNKGEKLPIFYYITIGKLLLVTSRHPLLLRSFIRIPRVRALTLLM